MSVHSASPSRILIVDADRAVQTALQAELAHCGHAGELDTAGTATEALERLRVCPYDVVISDYDLPDLNGLVVLESVQRLCPAARVILLSDSLNDSIRAEAVRLQVHDCLPKPPDAEEFRRSVQAALSQAAASRNAVIRLKDSDNDELLPLLGNLRENVAARAVVLADREGHLLAASGTVEDFPMDQAAVLAGIGMTSLHEIGCLMDAAEQGAHLCYREASRRILYIVNVGRRYLLVILCNRSPYGSRLGTVWYFAQESALALQLKLDEMETTSVQALPDGEISSQVQASFEHLLASAGGPACRPARPEGRERSG